VRASVIRKKKSFKRQYIKIERPEHPIYTVQIGAFTQASKALSTQKRAKEQFNYQPVFNKYIKKAKLYRVSIGRYENREDAFALADTMKEQYPDEYNKCWINFIP
jgi:cell division septation protein DedD